MSEHERFESLAGAVVLGEATASERATFDAHAATCAPCRADADGGLVARDTFARAFSAETWRPSIPVMERLRERRNARFRWSVSVLGWGVGLSLVLNVALAGGIGARLGNAFDAREAASNVVATAISVDAPHSVSERLAQMQRAPRRYAAAPAQTRKQSPRIKRESPAAPHPHVGAARVRAGVSEPTDDTPDVLAGLGLDGDASRNTVALETIPRCTAAADGDGAAVLPCRDVTGRVIR